MVGITTFLDDYYYNVVLVVIIIIQTDGQVVV